jgi:hypothetical protein
MGKRQNCLTKENIINKTDIYGCNFYLSFKGEKRFNTTIGSLTSILVIGVFMSYAIYKARIMFLKQDMSTVTNTFLEDINYTSPKMY